MENANLLAILVAAATGFLIGGLWYGPLFGKAWMAEHGFTEEQLRSSNMLKIYGLTFAFSVLSAVFLGHLLAFFLHDSALDAHDLRRHFAWLYHSGHRHQLSVFTQVRTAVRH